MSAASVEMLANYANTTFSNEGYLQSKDNCIAEYNPRRKTLDFLDSLPRWPPQAGQSSKLYPTRDYTNDTFPLQPETFDINAYVDETDNWPRARTEFIAPPPLPSFYPIPLPSSPSPSPSPSPSISPSIPPSSSPSPSPFDSIIKRAMSLKNLQNISEEKTCSYQFQNFIYLILIVSVFTLISIMMCM